MLFMGSMFSIYTFGNHLPLVYCFNEGFEKPENIQAYLDGSESFGGGVVCLKMIE